MGDAAKGYRNGALNWNGLTTYTQNVLLKVSFKDRDLLNVREHFMGLEILVFWKIL